jgi:hypothetical protein
MILFHLKNRKLYYQLPLDRVKTADGGDLFLKRQHPSTGVLTRALKVDQSQRHTLLLLEIQLLTSDTPELRTSGKNYQKMKRNIG